MVDPEGFIPNMRLEFFRATAAGSMTWLETVFADHAHATEDGAVPIYRAPIDEHPMPLTYWFRDGRLWSSETGLEVTNFVKAWSVVDETKSESGVEE